MKHSTFLSEVRDLPKPADRERAAVGLERWRAAIAEAGESDLADFAADLLRVPAGRGLLEAVFGNSPFLTQCLIAEPAFLRDLMAQGSERAFAGLLRDLPAALSGMGESAAVMAALRQAKRRAALAVALCDIAGIWPLEKVTGALSDFAECALGIATDHLLRRAAQAGEIALTGEIALAGESAPTDAADPQAADPMAGFGYVVLAMGKLGARELNYSSDIDLIVLYDADRVAYTGGRTLQDCFIRLTQALVTIMESRTKDGYVFRTDLRLRPDPGATPAAISVTAAESYYESLGQNWERMAMVKARPVAGDRAAGAAFLARLTPFVWRKSLDFATIRDIHSIKRQIDAHRGGVGLKAAGHNVKLGHGGIREIEFFVQTQQLIWGGRQPQLRERRTCAALRALVAAGHVAEDVAADLISAYRFLRRVEHRLQMVDDTQTHVLPTDAAGLERIAIFLGFADGGAFEQALLAHLQAVEGHYARLFEEAPPLGGPGNLVFTGTEPDPETIATLTGLGFANAASISAVIMGWHRGRYGATRSVRAREILTELLPALLAALAKTANPDLAFAKFDEFLSRLPAGVQLFSLFHANPALLDLVAEIMGSAPRIADRLARRPILLDGVLTPDFYDPLADAATLAKELDCALAQARDYEDALDITRRWAADKTFRMGVHILRNIIPAGTAGPALADIADAVIGALLPWVEKEFARRHGHIPDGAMAVVAFGKLGGREMMLGSDLDLVFVYDAPQDGRSDGAKPLAVHDYFARLSRRLINALTALTGEGRLYDVDMRLRPSGSSGPIASTLTAFTRYHEEAAWTWEHQALTRARPVAGPPALRRTIAGIVRSVLTRARDPARLARDIRDMRARIAREHPGLSPWDVKYMRGGLVDVEFIAQYLQLRHAHACPEILSPNTVAALEKAGAAGLLPAAAAEGLIEAAHLWQRILAVLRLCYTRPVPEEDPREGPRHALVAAAGVVDFTALTGKMAATASGVRGQFTALIEAPAEAPGGAPDGVQGGAQDSAQDNAKKDGP